MAIDQTTLAKYQALMGKSEKPILPLAESHIILVGAMGSGKTVMALTASDQCPDELPAKKLTQLDDVAYIPIEGGGLDSLKALRLQVNPKNIIPYEEILADVKHPATALSIAVDLAKGLQAGGVNKIVADSLSKFDLRLQGYFNTPEGKKLYGDKFAMFRLSLSAHSEVYEKFVEFKGMRIYCVHPKAVTDDLTQAGTLGGVNEKVRRQDLANGQYAEADLILGLTGKAAEIWPKDVSLQIGLQMQKQDGKLVRVAMTEFDPKSGIAVKSRFSGILAPVEKPHLGAIVRKIREFA